MTMPPGSQRRLLSRIAYKFLRLKHVPLMMAGTVVLRPLSYYRQLEITQGPWIGDRMENAVETKIVRGGPVQIDELVASSPRGYDPGISGTGEVLVFDSEIRYLGQGDPYVLCLSVGDFNDLSRTMCRKSDRNKDPYDACVMVRDVPAFLTHLKDKGTVDGKPLTEVFRGARFGSVVYSDVSRPPGAGQHDAPSPWLKDRKFSDQREIRFAAMPRSHLGDMVVVKFPDPDNFLTEMLPDL
jgi:hypothetical protein